MFGEKKSTLGALASISAAALFATIVACSSDDSSSGPDSLENAAAKTDTVYVRDTVYVPIDTNTASSSESVNPTSSDTTPASNSGTPASSADEQTSSATVPTSSAMNPESSGTNPASNSTTSSSVTPASSAATNPVSGAAADENLLWSDEFDGDAIDETKWGYNIGTGENGWGNSELEYYTNRPENVYVKDGMLHIRAQKEDYEGQKYTSTRLLSQNKFTFTYGTVEARIALPVGKGIWPAFWMLGENIDKVSWPTCGEIDIIEAVNDESVIYGTHHWAHEGSHAQYGNNTSDYYGTSLKLDISEFHTYKMTWDKEFITMYVDDFKYQEIDIKDTSSDMATFHKPFFFILNVAVGGSWPGFDIDDSQFPTEMQVDHIRVYK